MKNVNSNEEDDTLNCLLSLCVPEPDGDWKCFATDVECFRIFLLKKN